MEEEDQATLEEDTSQQAPAVVEQEPPAQEDQQAELPPLPEGFQLEAQQAELPPPPEGFQLEAQAELPPLPEGFQLETPQQPQAQQEEPEAEGFAGSLLRSAAHSVAPAFAGAAAGAAVGSGFVGVGAIPGAIIGGLLGGTLGYEGQEWLLKKFGFNDEAQQRANEAAHPVATGLGIVAGGVPAFGVGGVSALAGREAGLAARVLATGGERAVAGAVGGGIDYAVTGDPLHAAAVGGGMALVGGAPTALGQKATQFGERVAETVGWKAPAATEKISTTLARAMQEDPANAQAKANPETGATAEGAGTKPAEYPPGRPDQSPGPAVAMDKADVQTPGTDRPGPVSARGVAEDSIPPTKGAGVVSEPQNQPIRDSGNDGHYAKGAVPGEGSTLQAPGTVDEGVRTALKAQEVPARAPMQQAQQEQAPGSKPGGAAATVPQAPTQEGGPAGRAMGFIEQLKQQAAARERGQKAVDAAANSPYRNTLAAARQQDPSLLQRGVAPGAVEKLTPAEVTSTLKAGGFNEKGGGGGKLPPPGEPAGRAEPPAAPVPNIIPSQKEGLRGLGRSVKRILAPTTLQGQGDYKTLARDTGNEINRAHGEHNQILQQGLRMLDPHRELLTSMEGDRMRQVINRMQGGDHFPNFVPTKQEERLIADNKKFYDMWKPVLTKLDPEQKFVENYLPGLYKNEDVAKDFLRRWSAKGDAGMTKEKTFPTYEDARNAGLEPLTNDPIEMAMRYGMRARDFAAAETFKRNMVDKGMMQYFKEAPPGWERIRDTGQMDKPVYAPEDLAAVYNNYVDRGLRAQHARLYDATQHGLNNWTMLELGLNGYHFTTMGHEGIADDMSRAAQLAASGKIGKAGEALLKAPLAPYSTQKVGKQVIADYLDPAHKSVAMDLMRDADVRFVGREHAPETMASSRKSFYDHTSEASVKSQLNKAWKDIKAEAKGAFDDKDVAAAAKVAVGNAARAMQSISHPLFDVYIPRMKAGAIFKHVQDLLAANPNMNLADKTGPDYKAMLDMVRKHANSVDNRFGEAVMDHLFLNRSLQHSAQLGMRAFGWAVNSIKEIGGGSYSAGMGILNAATGREGNLRQKLSLSSPHQDPRIAYLIGFPLALAFASTVTQVAFTGSPPSSLKDFFLPRTGGLLGAKKVPETLVMPGYMKDVFGWVYHPFTEAYNKLNGLITTSYETARGVDGLGRSFLNPKDPVLNQVVDRMKYFLGRATPISIKNMMEGAKEGSKIPGFMTGMGFRSPGAYLQDPENFKRGEEYRQKRSFEQREKSLAKQARERGQQYTPRKAVPPAAIQTPPLPPGFHLEVPKKPSTLVRQP